MDEEDYDILPHKEITNLKKEIEELKKKVGGSKNIKGSIESLADSINNLMELLELAKEGMKAGDGEDQIVYRQIEPLVSKLDTIIDQNEKIAEGIVAIADMIKELKAKPILRPVKVMPQFEYEAPRMPLPGQEPQAPRYPPPSMPQQNSNLDSFQAAGPGPLPKFDDISKKRRFGIFNK